MIPSADPIRLQSLILADPARFPDPAMYLRTTGAAQVANDGRSLQFSADATIRFDTYFNLFNIGKWVTRCGLRQVGLGLTGTGRAEATVILARPGRTPETLVSERVDLDPDTPHRLDIPMFGDLDRGVLFLELRALGAGSLCGANWETAQSPCRRPDLVLSVTTFRREEAVAHTVARFRAFVSKSQISDHLHMIVVDNGQSAGIESDAKVTAIDSENLGGSGGFARGFLAARDRGASHCLFMDDDASTPMEAIERTWAFLAYARDPATTVAGATVSTRSPSVLWENGAVFDRVCRPLFGGTDLCNAEEVFEMEFLSTAPMPSNFYGGWWFFAFSIAEVRFLPFPFFVRGDDVSFSLVHNFDPITLPGVLASQEGFNEKESPLTLYLDMRSHLAHHLSLPSMDIGRRGVLRMTLWFWARALIMVHYETMAALTLAMEDVLRGPDFFAETADMTVRRADLGALRKAEVWKTHLEPQPDQRHIDPDKPWQRLVMKITVNGHLLPFFSRLGNRLTLSVHQRGTVREVWGAARITYFNPETGLSYQVRHSKGRALRESLNGGRAIWRLWWRHRDLKARWQAAYPELTDAAFWTRALKLETQVVAPAKVAEKIPD